MAPASSSDDIVPAALRVLVVDDHTSAKKLKKMLLDCGYQVTMRNLVKEALDVIEMKKDGFDIVMVDANVADMSDEFVQQVHLHQKNLPVIMMSVEDIDTKRTASKARVNGACCYLIKPIRERDMRYICQYQYVPEPKEPINSRSDADAAAAAAGGCGEKKRKFNHESAPIKKPRLVWTSDFHDKFVEVVNEIGLEKARPMMIRDKMREPSLTTKHIASHLQKYRESQKKNGQISIHAAGMNLCADSQLNPNSLHQNEDTNVPAAPVQMQQQATPSSHFQSFDPSPLLSYNPHLASNNMSCVVAAENTTPMPHHNLPTHSPPNDPVDHNLLNYNSILATESLADTSELNVSSSDHMFSSLDPIVDDIFLGEFDFVESSLVIDPLVPQQTQCRLPNNMLLHCNGMGEQNAHI